MKLGRKNRWMQMALLIAAFTAGTVTAQLMPAYEPFIGKVTYPTQSAAREMTHADRGYSMTSDDHRLTLVRDMK